MHRVEERPWSAARLFYLFLEKWAVSAHSHRINRAGRIQDFTMLLLPKYLKENEGELRLIARRQVMFAK